MNFQNGVIIFSFCLLFPLWAWWQYPLYFKAIIKDIRALRILHYMILTILGSVLFWKEQPPFIISLSSEIIFSHLLFFLSLTYAAIFAIVTNNIADLETDKISNPTRPLIKFSISTSIYLKAGMICLLIALIISLFNGYEPLMGIFFISLGYFMYSCKPLRLKRFLFLAKFIIGINSWLAALCGYSLMGGNWKNFPMDWSIFILVPLALAANFIDLKDTEGDRKMNVKTLPVVFGEQKAKYAIAFFTLVTYLMAGILLHQLWMYPLTIFAWRVHLYFLLKTPYNEKPVFLMYISSLVSLIILLLI
jgi:4-hydroxybenzoate polyprenyltransferase